MSKQKETKTNAMRILIHEKIPFITYTYECELFIDGLSIADQLGQEYRFVYKTLVTQGKSKEYFVFVLPIAAELDRKKAAKAVGEKAIEMIPVKDINAITGYIRGGCTAIGMKKQYRTVVDSSAETLDKMIVSGGKLGIQLELKPADYLRACHGEYASLLVE